MATYSMAAEGKQEKNAVRVDWRGISSSSFSLMRVLFQLESCNHKNNNMMMA